MPSFVYLEILDREINFFFSAVAETVDGFKPSRAAHLTIRGPYAREIKHSVIEACRRKLSGDVLRIGNVGRFSNPKEEVVYLEVDSPNLRKVWWKPDYPIGEYGFNPHISIYRGPDDVLAHELFRFFEHEKVELLCAEFRVVSHVSRQLEIVAPMIPLAKYPFHLIDSGRIRENLLRRLEVVVERHRRKSELAKGI